MRQYATAAFRLGFLVGLGLLCGQSASAQILLSLDINDRSSNSPAMTMPGFEAFVIGSVGSATAVQSNAVTRTFGIYSVTLSGSAPTITYDDRARATPADTATLTQGLLLRDFVFCPSAVNDTGLDITIAGLESNQVYQITIWSFDITSTQIRVSDWFANGSMVRDNYSFNGSTPPTDDTQGHFTFKATTTAEGVMLIQGRRDAGTARDGSVFINAIQVEVAPPDPPSFLVHPTDADFYAGERAVITAQLNGTAPFFYQWKKNGEAIPGATNSSLILPNVQTTDQGSYSLSVSNLVGASESLEAVLTVNPVADISTALLAYWPLDELTLITPDVSGNAQDLTATNLTPADLVAGQRGNAVQFNGTSTMLQRDLAGSPTLPAYGHASYTVAMWVKGDFTGQSDRRVFSESSTTNNNPLLNIGTHSSAANGTAQMYIRNDNGTAPVNHPATSLVAYDDTWHHLAWVDDRGYGRLYVDGVPNPTDIVYNRGIATLNMLTIGGIQRSNASHWFAGAIDDAAVWGRALTATEIQYAMFNGAVVVPPYLTNFNAVLPTDSVIKEKFSTTFRSAIYGHPTAALQWYKNNARIDGATNATFIVTNAIPPDAGDYTVVATNISGSITTRVATLTVQADRIPPFLVAASIVGGVSNITVTFSEAVAETTATNPANYRLTAGGGHAAPLVIAASLAGTNTVALTLSAARAPGVEYFLSASGVTDLAYTPNIVFPGAIPVPVLGSRLLFDFNHNWRYDTNGMDLGSAWREENFDDSAWPEGGGLFGVETVGVYSQPFLTYFSNYSRQTITYYFRTQFEYSNNHDGWVLAASNYIDDAAVVWLNGQEVAVYRMNPGGTNAFDTQAATAGPEGTLSTALLGNWALREGPNTLAVEVHQNTTNSTDLVFGMQLYLVKPYAISIAGQPASTNVTTGQSATLRVTAAGTFPQYQWLFDGTPIAGANSATLTASNAGNYSVVITNSISVATSAIATLTISPNPAPSVLSAVMDTNGVSATYGSVCTLTVQFSEPVNAADATNTGNYFIVREGDPTNTTLRIVAAALNATGDILTLTTDPKTDLQNYQLFIGNIRDRATVPATMAATSLFTHQRFLAMGARQTWWYESSGSDLGAAWREPSYNYGGWASAPGPFYSLDSDTANLEPSVAWLADTWQYLPVSTVVTTYYFRTVFDLPTEPTAWQLQFEIYADDGAIFYLNGQEVQFTASPGRYYMPNDGTPVTAGTLALTHTLNSGNIISQRTPSEPVPLKQVGNTLAVELHKSNATNTLVGFGLQLVATAPPLGKPVPPTVVVPPTSMTTNAGASISLTAAGDGTMPVTARWYFNGTNLLTAATIASSTNVLSLQWTNLAAGDEGAYTVVLSNAVGMVTSAVANLVVLRPPVFSQQPTGTNAAAGAAVTFAALASGSQPMQYQWYFAGNIPLFGQTNTSLTLWGLATGNAGDYAVVASNAGGMLTSAVARLEISTNVPPVPPSLTGSGAQLTGSRIFTVHVPTQIGIVYQLEYADQLGSPPSSIDWQPVPGASVSGDGTVKDLSDPNATQARRFYRVKASGG